mmetsp:Transcript_6409/g.13580  ORF Transcript_6409/g.13580 Transcript_6409/m.13580 type:complete len:234 (-) Transcript_6409:908-1609(-)
MSEETRIPNFIWSTTKDPCGPSSSLAKASPRAKARERERGTTIRTLSTIGYRACLGKSRRQWPTICSLSKGKAKERQRARARGRAKVSGMPTGSRSGRSTSSRSGNSPRSSAGSRVAVCARRSLFPRWARSICPRPVSNTRMCCGPASSKSTTSNSTESQSRPASACSVSRLRGLALAPFSPLPRTILLLRSCSRSKAFTSGPPISAWLLSWRLRGRCTPGISLCPSKMGASS